MSVLVDREIKELALQGMMHPFRDEKISSKIIGDTFYRVPSFGLSHAGYDVVLQPKWKYYSNTASTKHSRLAREEIMFDGVGNLRPHRYPDPVSILDNTEEYFEERVSEAFILKSGCFVLGVTEETFDLPGDIVGSLYCKSTLARMGLILPPTIAEPGWKGELVVEIFNGSPRDIILYAGVGIGQMIFWRTSGSDTLYDGKYQNQSGVQCAVQ